MFIFMKFFFREIFHEIFWNISEIYETFEINKNILFLLLLSIYLLEI